DGGRMSSQTNFDLNATNRHLTNYDNAAGNVVQGISKGTDDILVMIEVDKSSGKETVKSAEVVRGNWLERAITFLSRLFDFGKTYHYGNGAVFQDLSHMMDDVKTDFSQLARTNELEDKEIEAILETNRSFNHLVNSIGQIRDSSLLSKDEKETLEILRIEMCRIHELAIEHVQIIKTAHVLKKLLDQDGNVLPGREKEYLEHSL